MILFGSEKPRFESRSCGRRPWRSALRPVFEGMSMAVAYVARAHEVDRGFTVVTACAVGG
jgi:hypothetical protein